MAVLAWYHECMAQKTSAAIVALDQALSLATNDAVRNQLLEIRTKLPIDPNPVLDLVRIQSIRNNANARTHQILDAAGVPFVSREDAGRLCAHAIDHHHANALKELYRQHPQAMRSWLSTPPAYGAMKTAYDVAASKKLARKHKTMVALATAFGADWSIHRPGIEKTIHSNSIAMARLWRGPMPKPWLPARPRQGLDHRVLPGSSLPKMGA